MNPFRVPTSHFLTEAEKRAAQRELGRRALQDGRRTKITAQAIVLEVARCRILDGIYGASCDASCIPAATADLGLSKDQARKLRAELSAVPVQSAPTLPTQQTMQQQTMQDVFRSARKHESQRMIEQALWEEQQMEVLTLLSWEYAFECFVGSDDPNIFSSDPVGWWAIMDPVCRARNLFRADQIGVAHQQLLVTMDWLRANTPILLDGATLHKDIEISSPEEYTQEELEVDLARMDEESRPYAPWDVVGKLQRILHTTLTQDGRIATDADLERGPPSRTGGCLVFVVIDYLPPLPLGASAAVWEQLRETNRRIEEAGLLEFARDIMGGAGFAPDAPEGQVAVTGNRALVIDFQVNPESLQVATRMEAAGLQCRTLFSRDQITDACGYNCARWACDVRTLGLNFHTFSREEALCVFQPGFIRELNAQLGYTADAESARKLTNKQIHQLTGGPQWRGGTGALGYWLQCSPLDHWLECFERTLDDASEHDRVHIQAVNTEMAGSFGHHWFLVAWLIEPKGEEPQQLELSEVDEQEEMEEDEDRSREQLSAVVSAVALEMCLTNECREVPLDELYRELRRRDEWFTQFSADEGFAHTLSLLLDDNHFMVADAVVHMI